MMLLQNSYSNNQKQQCILPRVLLKTNTFRALKNNLIDYQTSTHQQYIQQVSIQNNTLLFQSLINDQLIVKKAPQCPCFILQQQKNSQLLFIGKIEINYLSNNRKAINFISNELYNQSYRDEQQKFNLLSDHQLGHTYAIVNSNHFANEQLEFHLDIGIRLKLGKIQLNVTKISLNESAKQILQQSKSKNCLSNYPDNKLKQQNECRICLSAEQQLQNSLLSICLCRGSSQYVHLNCIRSQIYSKAIQVKQAVKICHLSKVCCSICQSPLPKQIQVKNNKYQLIQFTSEKPFMLLQTKTKDKKLIFVQLQENRPISIGRNQQCDIRLKDSSISRSHAQIYFENNKVKIVDLKSKFGTILSINKKIQLSQHKTLRLQNRKSTFQFKITAQDA